MSFGYVLLVLVIYVLTIMRLTRLINADTILDRPRLAIAGRVRAALLREREATAHGHAESAEHAHDALRRWGTLTYFLQCPWCVGMWLSLGTAPLVVRLVEWHWWAFFPLALATSHLVGVFSRFADTEEIAIEDDANDTAG